MMKDLKDLKGPQVDDFFAHRVLAHHRERKQRKQVFIWRWVSGLSVVMGCFLSFYFYQQASNPKLDALTAQVNQAMVLHLTEQPTDQNIEYVSFEIDEGMHFDIEDMAVKGKRELTLAVQRDENGNIKLPFVFRSSLAGKKKISIKFLDADLNTVKVDEHLLNFVDSNL